MLLADLVATSNAVAETSGRLDKIGRLADLLRRLAPDEIASVIAFLSGSPRQGRIGVGGASIWGAKDIVPAAEPSLDVRDVDVAFDRIQHTTGRGSAADRAARLRDLFSLATSAEQDFLSRLLFGELRQGALEGVLVEAVARASNLPAPIVRRAAMMAGNLGAVAQAALTEGEAGLTPFTIQLLRPVQPMLAQSADGVNEALDRLGEAALEYKVDGARIQVHKAGDDVRIFSRALRDVTPAVPEIVELVRAFPVRDAILDGEAIALDPEGRPHPFQVTMRRFGRRLDVGRLRGDIPLSPLFFDLLWLDGEPLIDQTQARRTSALVALAPASAVVPHATARDVAAAQAFLDEALRHGHEGIMAKAIDAPYAAGHRGQAWVKVKVARTLDLVVLAAEWGHGRRKGWLSNLHLGARDPDKGGFVMLGKTFKGMTDEMLKWQTEKLQTLAIARDDYTVYVRPELVVEVAFNDIQTSSQYPGGLALRFARVKACRTDKTGAEADTIDTVREIFQRSLSAKPRLL